MGDGGAAMGGATGAASIGGGEGGLGAANPIGMPAGFGGGGTTSDGSATGGGAGGAICGAPAPPYCDWMNAAASGDSFCCCVNAAILSSGYGPAIDQYPFFFVAGAGPNAERASKSILLDGAGGFAVTTSGANSYWPFGAFA